MSTVERYISYLSLSYQDFSNKEAITYAEKNLNLFKRLSLASIRFKNMNDARNAYDKLLNKTPFEELAKLYSDDIANFKGVVSLDKYYFDLDLNIEKKEDLDFIFSLRESEFSKPIKIKIKMNIKYIRHLAMFMILIKIQIVILALLKIILKLMSQALLKVIWKIN